MNYEQILETSTPFDQNKLNLLDQVVMIFYTTANANDREFANNLLNNFKSLESAWTYCDIILNNASNIYTKIFMLGVLEDSIKLRWNLVDTNDKLNLRNFLIGILLKCIQSEETGSTKNHFLNKLNNIIVLIAINDMSSTWQSFISEICSSSKTDQKICENNLKILQMLNEEVHEFWKNSMTSSKSKELKNILTSQSKEIFELCYFIFENSQNVKSSLLNEAVKLYALNVQYFPKEYVFRDDIILRFLNDIKNVPQIRVDVLKCFNEIFSLQINPNDQFFFDIKLKTIEIYRLLIQEIQIICAGVPFQQKYKKLSESKRPGFEEFCIQLSLAIISFFKNSFSFIQNNDFIIGYQQTNDFLQKYANDISNGLDFVSQIYLVPNDEIFNALGEFWHWFCFKVCFLKEKDLNIEEDISSKVNSMSSFSNYIQFTNESFIYRNLYMKVLENVRLTIIKRMTKPVEVKIDLDEDGEIVMDNNINTIHQTTHENMKDCLIYLTHLEPQITEKIMLDMLLNQTVETEWDPALLNSLCWSIGCITGAMDESHEKRFVIMVIKHLLNLCELKRGKTNKAIVASNIMYVVGQYPRFLNAHWKFLKTVIKKLFEFMHESHPGVQDFACETFMKISIKCGDQIVKVNEGESEPYINILTRGIKEDTADLQSHQKLMFYEAIGNMIDRDLDMNRKVDSIKNMMSFSFSDWKQIFNEAMNTPDILTNNSVIKMLDINIKINERVALATKTAYFNFGQFILEDLMNAYTYYNGLANDIFNSGKTHSVEAKFYRNINRTILKFLCTMIKYNDDNNIIMNGILPSLGKLIELYRISHIENRDPDVLIVFSEILEKLKNNSYEYISKIWDYLCLFTLDMIKSNFVSYPEHRMNFFTLVKSLISNAFDALFQIQDSSFNLNVLDAIIWACKHDQPLMFETGLETLLILIKKVNENKVSNGINVADLFYKSFYFKLYNEIFCALTDSFHKSGFKLQVEILFNLTQLIEINLISENLFDPNTANKQYAMNYILNLLKSAYQNLNHIQIETFCIALFNQCYDIQKFKVLIRDFLVLLKTFSGNNEELFAEEKNEQINIANDIMNKKRNLIPGMNPIYDNETNKKLHSGNYQNFTN